MLGLTFKVGVCCKMVRSVGRASACSELAQHIEQLICSVSGVVPLSHDIRDAVACGKLSGGFAWSTRCPIFLHRHGYEPVRADAAGVPPVERVENPWHIPQVHDRKPSGRYTVVDVSG